ncbi:MAG: MAPEG family protein [Cyanobacteria bacterium SID2]|nr:MAPEG family protein [Cyanobacteria bacterium SID2]MBP0003874.1 MAPEG family protein [Cyanobacteria bacterium SBC]
MYAWTALVTISALIVYFSVTINVARARLKYKIMPPLTSGSPEFDRVFRVQQNTTEQLVLFLPILWIFSIFVSEFWGAILGSIWVVGRILYAWGYYQATEKRMPGFGMSSFATTILLAGSLVGVLFNLSRNFQ